MDVISVSRTIMMRSQNDTKPATNCLIGVQEINEVYSNSRYLSSMTVYRSCESRSSASSSRVESSRSRCTGNTRQGSCGRTS